MKFITLDRSKNVTYFGDCKLQFQQIEKCLNITLLDKVPEEIMTATFYRVFIRRNNLLCCMNQYFNNVMIIVFPTKEKCIFIYDAVIKEKLPQSQSINAPAMDENQIFKDCVYLPLVKAVQGGTPFFRGGHQGLKSILDEFVESLETDEVNYIFNNFPANLLVQTPVSTEMEETFVRQRKIVKPMHLIPAEPETPSFYSARTTFGISLPTNMHKQSISHKEDDEKEDKTVGSSRKKLKVSRKPSRKTSNVSSLTVASSSTPNVSVIDEPSPQNTPENVDFDIVEYLQDGILEKKLLVFTSNERKKCYEFMFIRKSCIFRCIKCLEQNKHVILKTTVNPGCRNFDFNTVEHVCESIEYLPENYGSSLIIKAPNFKLVNGKSSPSLIIFNSSDKNLCYKFGYDNSNKVYCCNQCITRSMRLTARFIQHGGENAIELNRLNHICQPKKCIP
uniref:Uncharacterized protein n=1 Tax=Panagrolaimus davidi TaxID=227884 RepID=A0A914PEP7_9BILA